MIIEGECTVNLDGRDYWTVSQFSKLTNRKEGTIRVLISKGNRIRKLETKKLGGKPFILAEELFNFPFVITGRPADMGDYIEQYEIQEDELVVVERLLKHDIEPITDSGV